MHRPSLVKIATYDDPIFAHLAQNKLKAENLQSFLDGEHHVAMDWMIANAVGGIKLLVAAEDRDRAIGILEEPTGSGKGDSVGTESNQDGEHCCPDCNSRNTFRERLRRKRIFLSLLLLGIPLPFISRRIICEDCGNKWKVG